MNVNGDAMDPMQRIVATLEEVRPLREEIKRRSMVYQCEEKEYAASRQGLPHDTYHYLPYAEWEPIRNKWGFNGKGET